MLALVLIVAVRATAQTNTITFTNKSGEVVRDAKVLAIWPSDLFYETPGGGSRVHLADLPPEVSSRFGYDSLKAAKYIAEKRRSDEQRAVEPVDSVLARNADSTLEVKRQIGDSTRADSDRYNWVFVCRPRASI